MDEQSNARLAALYEKSKTVVRIAAKTPQDVFEAVGDAGRKFVTDEAFKDVQEIHARMLVVPLRPQPGEAERYAIVHIKREGRTVLASFVPGFPENLTFPPDDMWSVERS